MESLSEPTNTVWSFPFMSQDWEQTPLAVQAYVRTLRGEVAQLHDRVEMLEARLAQNSTTSSLDDGPSDASRDDINPHHHGDDEQNDRGCFTIVKAHLPPSTFPIRFYVSIC